MNLRQMGLNKNSKICQITHKDLDGVGCSILMSQCFNNIDRVYCTYSDVDEMVLKIIQSKIYDFIFLTDICPSPMVSLDFDNIILLDHHGDRLDRHRPKYNQYVVEKFCGTTLTKKFLEAYFSIKLNKFDSLAYLIQDYDLWKLNNPKSTFLNTLFYYYWEDEFFKRFFYGGTRLNKKEIEFIREKRKEYLKIFDNLKINLIDNQYCKIGFIETDLYINELCHDSIKQFSLDIMICRNIRKKSVSIRSHERNPINIGEILSEMGIGGGHKHAAGFSFDSTINAEQKCKMFIDVVCEKYKKGF